MSFLYPRTIKVTRPAAQTGVGWQPGYAGEQPTNDPVIAQDIPASIQAKGRQGKDNPAHLPSDATVSMFTVFIPRAALARGTIKDRDVIIDDLGDRYQVLADGWDSLGYAVVTQRLET